MMAALGRIPDPVGGDIVSKGRVQAPRIKDGVASLILDVTGLSAEPPRGRSAFRAAEEAAFGRSLRLLKP